MAQRKRSRNSPRKNSVRHTPGRLLIIGGHEDKEGQKDILRYIAEHLCGSRLVIATVASNSPKEMLKTYIPIFRSLGVRHIHNLNIETRKDAKSDRALRTLRDATCVFFTGGDQLKITSLLGDSPVYQRIQEIYHSGGTIVGTSAGASIMSETMLVGGHAETSYRIGSALQMAPGLGLIRGIIIDQHFTERGRIGRILGAVAQNPKILGIGIDENTAIVMQASPGGPHFEVIGDGAVYVVDGSPVSYSNLTEADINQTLSIFGIRLHLLSRGDRFDCRTRSPSSARGEPKV